MEPPHLSIFPTSLTGVKSSPDEFQLLQLLPRVHQNYDCNANVTNSQKLLVFDHSGDETTLVFDPTFPVASKPQPAETSKHTVNRNIHAPPLSQGVRGENVSDTAEDTDEIDALLYSDDDEEDVNSTGHSPAITGDLFEEVASSDGYRRKRKVQINCESSSPLDADVSKLADDAESKCLDQRVEIKRVKRERIRETIGILQGIIPGGKNVEPTRVLDAAIEYLHCLKHRAEAMGPFTYRVW